MKKLNQKGFAHWIIPALVIVAIGGIGTYLLTASHADTLLTGPGKCGSGYQSWAQFDGTYVNTPAKGYVEIYRNPNLNKMCVINTAQGASYGVAKPMDVHVDVVKADGTVNGGDLVRSGGNDSGQYKYYAGPVYVSTQDYYSSKYCLRYRASETFKGVTATSGGQCVTL